MRLPMPVTGSVCIQAKMCHLTSEGAEQAGRDVLGCLPLHQVLCSHL